MGDVVGCCTLQESLGRFRAWRDAQRWRFAKSYANKSPHEYVWYTHMSAGELRVFRLAASFVWRMSHEEKYFRSSFQVWYFEGYKYWAMKATKGEEVGRFIVINRSTEAWCAKHGITWAPQPGYIPAP